MLKIGFREDGRIIKLEDASSQSAGLDYTINDPDLGPPSGATVEIATVAATGIRTEIARDARGNVIRRMERVINGSSNALDVYRVTVFTFDAQDNPTGESRQLIAQGNDRYTVGPTVASQWVSRSTYDALGNVLSSVDAAGNVTLYGNYDRYGNAGTITDVLGNTTVNSYDDHGQLRQTTDAAGNVTRFTYDADGNLASVVQVPSGEVETFEYDGLGR